MSGKWFGVFCLACLAGFTATLHAANPIAQQIDLQIESAAKGVVAELTTDEEFCRRLYLDLAGRIPSVGEREEFLRSAAADKRDQLIQTLIAGPEFPRRMRDVWHVQLMERLGDHAEWSTYLETAFAENRPWQTVVQQILNPSADQEATRGSAFFLTRRLENYGQNPVDLPALTRDVGRLFLGVDLQCAQCHDHLFIDDYKQVDFQGLHSFLAHTFIRQDVKFPAVGEKLVAKKTDFMSVFLKEPHQTGPRLPFGSEVEIVSFEKGQEFSVPPDKATRFLGQPKFSPLTILAESLPTLSNRAFVENTVNRWWWVMMGRGLVHPLDLMHSQNSASHPEVLKILADEFIAHGGDVRWLLATLAQTKTYQRTSRWTITGQPARAPDRFAVALERPLSAEQLVVSIWRATGHADELPKEAITKFTTAFANPPREPEGDFAPSVKAALFLSHSDTVLNWTASAAKPLIQQTPDGTLQQRCNLACLQVLSREINAAEWAAVESLRAKLPDEEALLEQLVWALVNSTEFCLNH